MTLVELSDFRPGSPADIAVAALVQIGICNLLEAPKPVVPSCQFVGEGLVLEEVALRRRPDCLLVQRHSIDIPPFKARPFRRDQRVLMSEGRRAARGPTPKRPQMLDKILAKFRSPLRRRSRKDRSDGKRMVKAVIHRLKVETGRPENRPRFGGKLKSFLRVAQ